MRVRSLLLAGCALIAGSVGAQSYPNRTIRMVSPYAPGGGTDHFARIIGQKLAEALGVSVVTDNRPGAGGQTRAVNRGPLAGCERPRVGWRAVESRLRRTTPGSHPLKGPPAPPFDGV